MTIVFILDLKRHPSAKDRAGIREPVVGAVCGTDIRVISETSI
ncbi:hypothetical protein [Leptospira interrogans]|nr:hypothetical protein [Leptospira interrogans]